MHEIVIIAFFPRKYLPILKLLPNQYIHEPWEASEAVQKAAKCIIGKDYPMPMINHQVAYRINIARMKQVYRCLPKYRTPCITQGITSIHSLKIKFS